MNDDDIERTLNLLRNNKDILGNTIIIYEYHDNRLIMNPENNDGSLNLQTNLPNLDINLQDLPDLHTNVPDLHINVPDLHTNVPDLRTNVPDDLHIRVHDLQANLPDLRENNPNLQANLPDLRENDPNLQANLPNLRENAPNLRENDPNLRENDPRFMIFEGLDSQSNILNIQQLNHILSNISTESNTAPFYNLYQSVNDIDLNNPYQPIHSPMNSNTNNPIYNNLEDIILQLEGHFNDITNIVLNNDLINPGNNNSNKLSIKELSEKTELLFLIDNNHEFLEEKCSICTNNYELNDILRKVNICNHVFHQKCIDIWLNDNITCPICRRNIKIA